MCRGETDKFPTSHPMNAQIIGSCAFMVVKYEWHYYVQSIIYIAPYSHAVHSSLVLHSKSTNLQTDSCARFKEDCFCSGGQRYQFHVFIV